MQELYACMYVLEQIYTLANVTNESIFRSRKLDDKVYFKF